MKVLLALALVLVFLTMAWGQPQGVDADSHLVGQTLVWALGDIDPGGETSFVVETMPGAVSYRIAVDTFDVVSAGRAP